MGAPSQKPVMWTVVACAVVLLVVLGYGLYTINSNVKDGPSETELTNAINTAVESAFNQLEFPNISLPEFSLPEYYPSEEDYEDEISENKAKILATDFIEDNDFIDELVDWFNVSSDNGYNTSTQSDLDNLADYDEDDLSIEILDVDVDLENGEKAIVTFDIKVYDDDDRLVKINDVEVEVVELDYDDDFEDAEVNENYAFFDGITNDDIKVYN